MPQKGEYWRLLFFLSPIAIGKSEYRNSIGSAHLCLFETSVQEIQATSMGGNLLYWNCNFFFHLLQLDSLCMLSLILFTRNCEFFLQRYYYKTPSAPGVANFGRTAQKDRIRMRIRIWIRITIRVLFSFIHGMVVGNQSTYMYMYSRGLQCFKLNGNQTEKDRCWQKNNFLLFAKCWNVQFLSLFHFKTAKSAFMTPIFFLKYQSGYQKNAEFYADLRNCGTLFFLQDNNFLSHFSGHFALGTI